MRQIKFRVWNNKTRKWIHGPHESSSLDGVNLFGETILLGYLLHGISIQDLNEVVALQFTGLHDISGREIFEGDILSFKRWANMLQYGGESSGEFRNAKAAEVKFIAPSYVVDEIPLNEIQDAKVIGNIYDNPELCGK